MGEAKAGFLLTKCRERRVLTMNDFDVLKKCRICERLKFFRILED